MKKRVAFCLFWIFLLPISLLALSLSAEIVQADYYIPGCYISNESKCFLDVLNPTDERAELQGFVYSEKKDPTQFILRIEPHRAKRVDISAFASGFFGASISADKTVGISYVTYDGAFSGGLGSLASTKTSSEWYFGEGYTSGMAKTYLYLLNPGAKGSDVTVTLYYANSETRKFSVHVPAKRALSIDLKEKTMPEKRFGIKVSASEPIAVSTANFNRKFSAGSGGVGVSETAKKLYFADGYTSLDTTDFLNIINPTLTTAHLSVTFYYDDGTTTYIDETVPAYSKKLLMLGNYVSELRWFSTEVLSDADILAELTHYDESRSAGYGVFGSAEPLDSFYFSYAVAGADSKSYLALFNPSQDDASLELIFYYEDGTVKSLQAKAASLRRSTINLNEKALSGRPFGLIVKSSAKIFSTLTVYENDYSAGYGYSGGLIDRASLTDLALPESARNGEEAAEDISSDSYSVSDSDSVIAGKAVLDSSKSQLRQQPEYVLSEEEKVSSDKFNEKFNEKITAGLESVVKQKYKHDSIPLLLWHFSYSTAHDAENASQAILSGVFLTLSEYYPVNVKDVPAFSFEAKKSSGYLWQAGSSLYLVVAPKEQSEAAQGLAEQVISEQMVDKEYTNKKAPVSLKLILLLILALLLLILLVRWIFRRSNREFDELDEDDYDNEDKEDEENNGRDSPSVWEEQIPSAKPKKKKKGKKQPKHSENKRSESKNSETKKNETKKIQKSAEIKKTVDQKKDPKKMTAQDFLDAVEDIPDYEDVFKHVNRENEVIKPK
jgi:hypothetical protein